MECLTPLGSLEVIKKSVVYRESTPCKTLTLKTCPPIFNTALLAKVIEKKKRKVKIVLDDAFTLRGICRNDIDAFLNSFE